MNSTIYHLSLRPSLSPPPTGPPDTPEITTGPQFTENNPAQMVCVAHNGYPAPALRWYNNDVDISENADVHLTKNADGRFDAISTLNFEPARADNQHMIKCLAQHESLSEPYPADSLKIDVDCECISVYLYI